MRSRARAWLLNPVLVILVLLALGGAYERTSQSTAPAVAMRGQLVDVGPYRVCVYDRAGRGWSDPAATPPDGAQIATDLHTLLNRAHVPGPYVLAGHSFGGLYVRTYAAKYPEEVAGLVVVDSTTAHTTPVSAPTAGSYSILKHASSLIATTSHVGLGWLLANSAFSTLPPKYRDDARATAATGKEMGGFLDEFGVANRSEAEAGTLRTLGAPCIASSKGQTTTPSSTTRSTPPPSPGRSTTSSYRSAPGHRSLTPDAGTCIRTSAACHVQQRATSTVGHDVRHARDSWPSRGSACPPGGQPLGVAPLRARYFRSMTRLAGGLVLAVLLCGGCGGQHNSDGGPLGTVGDGPHSGSMLCIPVHDDGLASVAWETIENTSDASVTVVGVDVDSDRVDVEDWFLAGVAWGDAGVTGGRLPDPENA